MFEKEIKDAKKEIIESAKNVDAELVKIKVAIHTLDKLGFNTSDLEKQLDNVGIEFYKLKGLFK